MVKNLPAIRQHSDDSIALALGGGAARGLAHILILEALDEVGIRPTMLAGTSMGAIIGSLYCTGMTGAEIREFATELFKSRGQLIRRVVGKWPNSITDLWNPRTPALFNAETLFGIVMPDQLPDTFEELATPIRIIATDFYSQEQVMIDSGPLLPAICASSSLPVLFEPVRHNGRILIDGGFVNPTPFDIITDAARYTVAVDVNGKPQGETGEAPGSMDCLLGAFFITLRTILNHKLEIMTPDILVSPDVGGFRALRFYQIEEILAASEPAKDEFKRDLDKLLNRTPVDA